MPVCFGRTKGGWRCKKRVKSLHCFCAHHRWQPILLAATVLTFVGLVAGIYQDLVWPVYTHFGKGDSVPNRGFQGAEIEPILVVLRLSHSYSKECLLKPEIEYYLVRSQSPLSQTVVESGIARIAVPEGVVTFNREIPLPSHTRLETVCTLPKSTVLQSALESGGFELLLVITTHYGEVRNTPKQKIFDPVSLKQGFDFHVNPTYKDKLDSLETSKVLDTGD